MSSAPRGNALRTLRIGALLGVLVFVALGAWQTKLRSTDWNDTLWVALYPINGDGSAATERYVTNLDVSKYAAVDSFMAREAKRYGVAIEQPVYPILAARVDELPPAPPPDGNVLKIIWWSLKLRYWAGRQDPGYETGPDPDIRIFVVYHDPEVTERVPDSLGLEKGLIGVVNAWAGPRETGANNVVIAHELLHTLGASDKYEPATSLPLHPDGFAEPDRDPLYPQRRAEIMGGRIPVSPDEATIPGSLRSTVVGPATATEINWIAERR
ncbi:MAG: hypothetical protein AAGD86_04180 [Pseudomonadota bacterium]